MSTVRSIDQITRNAVVQCKNSNPAHNLLLQHEFAAGLLDEHLPLHIEELAAKWQDKKTPRDLHINHGAFIHKHGDGIIHIVEELRLKGDSNRALWSLISMDDIVGSGDVALPSFLILQFALLKETLLCTAYFRALEVARFLPINLGEIFLVMRRIRNAFPQIKRVKLTIHAFRAYVSENFDCLTVSSLDLQKPGRIAARLQKRDLNQVRAWLFEKMRESTVVLTRAVEEMHNYLLTAPKDIRSSYSSKFITELGLAKDCLLRLKSLRTTTSRSHQIENTLAKYREHLSRAIGALQP